MSRPPVRPVAWNAGRQFLGRVRQVIGFLVVTSDKAISRATCAGPSASTDPLRFGDKTYDSQQEQRWRPPEEPLNPLHIP